MSRTRHDSRRRGRHRSHLGELTQTPLESFARTRGTANDENGVVSAHRSENIRPRLAIQRRSNWLSPSGDCPDDDQLANTVDSSQELWQEGIEGWPRGAAERAVGRRVPHAFRRRNASEPELPQVPRERGLSDIPPALMQQDPQLLLAAYGLVAHQFQYGRVTLPLVQAKVPPWVRREHTPARDDAAGDPGRNRSMSAGHSEAVDIRGVQ